MDVPGVSRQVIHIAERVDGRHNHGRRSAAVCRRRRSVNELHQLDSAIVDDADIRWTVVREVDGPRPLRRQLMYIAGNVDGHADCTGAAHAQRVARLAVVWNGRHDELAAPRRQRKQLLAGGVGDVAWSDGDVRVAGVHGDRRRRFDERSRQVGGRRREGGRLRAEQGEVDCLTAVESNRPEHYDALRRPGRELDADFGRRRRRADDAERRLAVSLAVRRPRHHLVCVTEVLGRESVHAGAAVMTDTRHAS